MSKFHIFGGDWVIQPVKTEKLRGIKLFYPPGSSLTRQALIWGSFRVFFARLPRKRVGGSAYRRIGVRGRKTAFRHGYLAGSLEEGGDAFQTPIRRNAEMPTRRPADTLPFADPLPFRGQDTSASLSNPGNLR
jgi:hypothetical protein